MQNLKIAASVSSPQVDFDASQGMLSLRGESYPENSLAFYRPLIEWLRDYLVDSSQPIVVKLDLAYLNTGSIRYLMDIFDLLEDAYLSGRKIQVNWYYDEENDRALEAGEEFQEDLTLPFALIAKPSCE